MLHARYSEHAGIEIESYHLRTAVTHRIKKAARSENDASINSPVENWTRLHPQTCASSWQCRRLQPMYSSQSVPSGMWMPVPLESGHRARTAKTMHSPRLLQVLWIKEVSATWIERPSLERSQLLGCSRATYGQQFVTQTSRRHQQATEEWGPASVRMIRR